MEEGRIRQKSMRSRFAWAPVKIKVFPDSDFGFRAGDVHLELQTTTVQLLQHGALREPCTTHFSQG